VKGVLISIQDCTELLSRMPLGIRLEEGVLLDAQVRKVLKIERAIRSLDSDSRCDNVVPDHDRHSDRPLVDVSLAVNTNRSKLSAGGDSCFSINFGCSSSSGGNGGNGGSSSSSSSSNISHDHIGKQITSSLPSLLEGGAHQERDSGPSCGNPIEICLSDHSQIGAIGLTCGGENCRAGSVETGFSEVDAMDIVSDPPPPLAVFRSDLGTRFVQCETASDGVDIESRKPVASGDADGVNFVHKVKKRIHWDELIAIARDVDSVMPIKCRKAELLLRLFNDVNEWTVRHLGGILHHSPFVDIYAENTTASSSATTVSLTGQSSTIQDPQCPSSSARHKKMNPLVPILNRISLHYGFSPVHIDTFAAEDFLDFRVGLFMERMDTLRGGGKSIDIAKAKAECASSQRTNTRAPTNTPGAPPVGIICLCRMPDSMGETPVMSQCDTCDRWFHPNCTNALLVSRSASQTVESFECPLCLHARGRPSNFAFKPISEWRVSIHNLQGKKGRPKGPVSIAHVPDAIMKSSKKETVKTKKEPKSSGSEQSGVLDMELISGSCGVGVGNLKADQHGSISGRVRANEGQFSSLSLEGTSSMSSAVPYTAVDAVSDPAVCNINGRAPCDDGLVYRCVPPSAASDIPNNDSVLDAKGDIIFPSNCTTQAPSHPPVHLLSVPTSRPTVSHQKILKKQLSRDPMTVPDVTAAMAAEKELQVQKV
jgi:hypothetical protein